MPPDEGIKPDGGIKPREVEQLEIVEVEEAPIPKKAEERESYECPCGYSSMVEFEKCPECGKRVEF